MARCLYADPYLLLRLGVFDIVDKQDDLVAIGFGEDDALTAIPVKDQVAMPLGFEQGLLKVRALLDGDQVADKAEGHPAVGA
ncbi:hypothetical protein QCD60_00005 [Pokkaliibacter sp. MBI-7]|uniref:hypothetical protein n=1 Tax=Pokkaliibacter sp. MBI-7 TaxID=3040600 RepID=UPI002449FC15|nr:hypothetical protein [Pokkaliibacter sp. MBI-7]MDH2430936.1 hypothetical protein [Pokkaliibacter sp. MBI-7]